VAEVAQMFTPKWKKEAQMLVKGALKFVHYKRDLLSEGTISEIESRRQDLLDAIRTKDREKVSTASAMLQTVCEQSLPHQKPLGAFEENVEVIFVAIVIALGLRAYYLQPFRIPTGSMQPTLNGIIGTPMPEESWPSLPQRIVDQFLRGRTYAKVVADRDLRIATDRNGRPMIGDVQFLHYFSRSQIVTVDSQPGLFSWLKGTDPVRLPAPVNPCRQIGLAQALQIAELNNGVIPKGTVICEGAIDTGDWVLVDKFSYHFRKPRRGEVFVFDTLGIRGIHDRSGEQASGSHYIKRLCGVPGDTLTVQPPNLIVNGQIASEPSIRRVSEAKGPYAINPQGYIPADPREARAHAKPVSQYITKPGETLTLTATAAPGMREYAALGDNTGNSLDSRYWGTVKGYNLVGPALCTFWPITNGHWGFIR